MGDGVNTYVSCFKIGDIVTIDGDTSIRATVTAAWFSSLACQLQVSWIHNGTHQQTWIEDWRLKWVAATAGAKGPKS